MRALGSLERGHFAVAICAGALAGSRPVAATTTIRRTIMVWLRYAARVRSPKSPVITRRRGRREGERPCPPKAAHRC